jgi:hypothetical protein
MQTKNVIQINVEPVAILTAVLIFIVLLLHQGNYTYNLLEPIRILDGNKLLQSFTVGGF